MTLLAVETSGRTGSIALLRESDGIVERLLTAEGRRHAQTLVADAESLLAGHGLSPRDVTCVAVSIGPGSFTGLRVGVVFAKTFGWLNKCPVVAVPTLAAVAAQAPTDADHIVTVADAQRGELFSAEYGRTGSVLSPLTEVTIQTPAAVLTRITADSCVIGPALANHQDQFHQEQFPVTLAPESDWEPRAATIAALGHAAFRTGNIADPWKLEPFYIRRSYAEEKRDAQNSRT